MTPRQTARSDAAGSRSTFDYWRNFVLHGLEGGLYMGGAAFVDLSTVMPPLILALGGPTWLIGLMPAMAALGFVWPPLFTAHWIERMFWFRPLILATGIFQRLPYLVAAVSLFLPQDKWALCTIAAVALAPFISGAIGGISLTAWQQFVAKTIPRRRLSSLWALRQIVSASIGICAGGIIALVLEKFPGIHGYGVLHLIAFGFLLVSYIMFTQVRDMHR
jgi:MFS family permease